MGVVVFVRLLLSVLNQQRNRAWRPPHLYLIVLTPVEDLLKIVRYVMFVQIASQKPIWRRHDNDDDGGGIGFESIVTRGLAPFYGAESALVCISRGPRVKWRSTGQLGDGIDGYQ